jgi:hypothetical protein
MKILRSFFREYTPWIGEKLSCWCGCEFQLEEGDRVQHNYTQDTPFSERTEYRAWCPDCQNGVLFNVSEEKILSYVKKEQK